ncbi:hypothetical protein STEG23_013458, partial [Scotinomys teguina]
KPNLVKVNSTDMPHVTQIWDLSGQEEVSVTWVKRGCIFWSLSGPVLEPMYPGSTMKQSRMTTTAECKNPTVFPDSLSFTFRIQGTEFCYSNKGNIQVYIAPTIEGEGNNPEYTLQVVAFMGLTIKAYAGRREREKYMHEIVKISS